MVNHSIKGLCYLDSSVPSILEFAIDLINQMDLTVSNFVKNPFFHNQLQKCTLYLRQNWLNLNNIHFL